jgi:hypothetical protein
LEWEGGFFVKLKILRIAMVWPLLLVGEVGNAIPVPTLNVPALAASSNLIIVGNVVSIRDGGAASVSFLGGSTSARLMLCEVEVDSVLKGAIQGKKLSFRQLFPNEPIGYLSVVVGYQMIFLRTADSEYELASPYHGLLPAVPGTESGSGDELVRIASRLGAVLQSSSAAVSQKQMALYALSTIRNPESTILLHKVLEQSDAVLRLNAAGFLLLRNDLAGMQPAEEALTHPQGLPGNVLHNLNYAIHEGVTDQNAVPALERLTQVQELETRRAVASALRHTRSMSALRPLAYLLDDGDVQVRHDVVVGLAQITGDLEWGPNLDLFQAQEQRYMKHWLDWRASNGLERK